MMYDNVYKKGEEKHYTKLLFKQLITHKHEKFKKLLSFLHKLNSYTMRCKYGRTKDRWN